MHLSTNVLFMLNNITWLIFVELPEKRNGLIPLFASG